MSGEDYVLPTNRDRPVMLIFYPLCYAAVLKILTYYAQYYAQEQELCSAHIIIIISKFA